MPLTWCALPVWLIFLGATKAAGFETAPYDALEMLGLLLIIAAVLGRLWCSLYISGRKDKEGPYSIFFTARSRRGVLRRTESHPHGRQHLCVFRLLRRHHRERGAAAREPIWRRIPSLRSNDPTLLSSRRTSQHRRKGISQRKGFPVSPDGRRMVSNGHRRPRTLGSPPPERPPAALDSADLIERGDCLSSTLRTQ